MRERDLLARRMMSIGNTTLNPYVNDTAVNTWFICSSLVLGLAGTVGNVMVIGAVLFYKPLRTLPNTFIVNLACADLCVSVFIQFPTVVAVLQQGAIFDSYPVICHVFGFICTVSCICSVWSITLISINRYVCICHNSMYHRIYTPGIKMVAMVAGLWLGTVLVDLPAVLELWGKHSYDPKVMFCTFDYTDFSYTIFLVSVGVGLPVVLVSYSYIRILLFVRASRRTLRRLSKDAGGRCLALGNGLGGIRRRDMTLLRTVVTLWCVFLIMWTPYTVYILFDREKTWDRTLFVLFVNLCHGNSSINWVIYAATNPTFRKGYVAFIKKLACQKITRPMQSAI